MGESCAMAKRTSLTSGDGSHLVGGWVGHAIILPTVCDVRGFVLMMMYNGVIKVTKARSYNLLHMSPWQKSIDHWVEHFRNATSHLWYKVELTDDQFHTHESL